MKVVFAGTPGIAAACLQALLKMQDVDVVGVLSQPDRRAGRGMKLTPSPVKALAEQQGIDCITPDCLRDERDLQWVLQKEADFLVVVAFGMILPEAWLQAARISAINVHASLLPRWRGAAPIERALLAGDEQTGICIMCMDEGLDTGPVYCRSHINIDADMTGRDLWQAVQKTACELLTVSLPDIFSGHLMAVRQSTEGVSYAKKITADDRLIRWLSAEQTDRQVRCFTPRPGARCRWRGGWLKVIEGQPMPAQSTADAGQLVAVSNEGLDIACADGSVYRLLSVQPEGKKVMHAADFSRGQHLRSGDLLISVH